MKITTDQIHEIRNELSFHIERDTDIRVNEQDLLNLGSTLTEFLEEMGVNILEPEEFEVGKFLTLTVNCHYGVVAFPKDMTFGKELHGPFMTETEARGYIYSLRKEYGDYERFAVCKIELPVVSPDIWS